MRSLQSIEDSHRRKEPIAGLCVELVIWLRLYVAFSYPYLVRSRHDDKIPCRTRKSGYGPSNIAVKAISFYNMTGLQL